MRARGNNPIAWSLAAAVALAAPLASAQDQAATAEALFREARDLSAHGRYAEACPKFAASQKLDPGYGTLYNLGECLTHEGKTASAWAAFHEAASLARTAGQAEREAKAARAVVALETKLERITISVTAPLQGLLVRRDGITIDAAAWGSALPVDPGKHLIEASAPGKKTFSIEVTTAGPGKPVTVEIQALLDAPIEPAPLAAPRPLAPPADSGAGRRVAAYVTGGVGVAGIVVGAVMGSMARSKWNEAQMQHCRTSTLCDAEGVDLVSGAQTGATVATIGFIAGGALLATGVVLFATALPKRPATTGRLVLSPMLAPTQGGLSLRGSF
jgi:hypothetical protein